MFCLECSRASHGSTACRDHSLAKGGEGQGGGGGREGAGGGEGSVGGEGQELTKDYRVFDAMIRKTGSQRLSPNCNDFYYF